MCTAGHRATSGGRHRLGIVVYAAKQSNRHSDGLSGPRSSSNSSAAAAASDSSTPLAVLQLTGSRSRRRLSSWQRLLLPTTYVQDALDSGSGTVRLRIVCDGCDAFGRRLVVQPAAASAAPSVATAAPAVAAGGDQLPTPYLEVVARRNRRSRRRRRHRHRLCRAAAADHTGGSRPPTMVRRRC